MNTATHLPAIAPPIPWRGDPRATPTPPGYRLILEGSADAGLLWRIWGVRPTHYGMCAYALWVPIEGAPPMDSPLGRAAQAWLTDGGAAARHVAERDYPFGAARICGYANDLAVALPCEAGCRARDIYAFFEAAKRVLAAYGDGPIPEPPPDPRGRY